MTYEPADAVPSGQYPQQPQQSQYPQAPYPPQPPQPPYPPQAAPNYGQSGQYPTQGPYQSGAYPQGSPHGYPQGQPQGYPQGHQQGYPQGYPPPYPQMSVAPKSPGVAVLASFFIPGLGSMISGRGGLGALILCLYVLSWILTIVIIGIFGVIGFWIWGMVQGYNDAVAWNRAHGIIS